MKAIRFLGLILLAVGIVIIVLYNVVLGGILAFLGAIIFITPSRKLTKKRVIHEFGHKVEALKLEAKERFFKKKAEALKKEREKHVRMAKR